MRQQAGFKLIVVLLFNGPLWVWTHTQEDLEFWNSYIHYYGEKLWVPKVQVHRIFSEMSYVWVNGILTEMLICDLEKSY